MFSNVPISRVFTQKLGKILWPHEFHETDFTHCRTAELITAKVNADIHFALTHRTVQFCFCVGNVSSGLAYVGRVIRVSGGDGTRTHVLCTLTFVENARKVSNSKTQSDKETVRLSDFPLCLPGASVLWGKGERDANAS